MEVNKETFSILYNDEDGLKYDYCSGNFINYKYSKSGDFLSKSYYKEMSADKLEYNSGGLFMIKKSLWISANGMKNKLRRSQDWDLSFRLASKGYLLRRIKETLANHHTISYQHISRIWKMFFNGDRHYRIVILRENLFNKFQWKHFIRINYTFLLLIVSVWSLFLYSNFYLLTFYLGLIIFRAISRRPSSILVLLSDIFLIFLYEISIVPSLLFFWPKNYKEEYEFINPKT
tara:strand:- start:1413 stop:2108 length:696 start_codon:yes stop_codon:yes gene_type:complete